MTGLTRALINLGFTRDMALWFWTKIVAVAAIIVSGVFNVSQWFAYCGIPISDTTLHRITAGAAIILWFAGSYSQSPLPSKAEVNSVTPPHVPAGGV